MLTETQQKIIELLQSGDQANIDMVLNWSEEATGFDHIQWIEDIFGTLIGKDDYILNFNKNIYNLFNLKSINLSNMILSEIPKSLQYLSQLENLWLHSNNITSIPVWITKLDKLKKMSLDNNPISELPEFFGELINLESLYLANLNIKKLPESISNCKNLFYISVHDSPIEQIPQSFKNLEHLLILDCINTKLNEEDIDYWSDRLGYNIIG